LTGLAAIENISQRGQTMKSIGFVAMLLLLMATSLPRAASGTGDWLPLTRSDLFRLLAREKDTAIVRAETLEDMQRLFLAGPKADSKAIHYLEARPAELTSILAPDEVLASDETISIVWNPAVPLTLVVAGQEERIHSLRATAPVVNYTHSQSDHVFAFLSALFTSIYPAWLDAREWPIKALQEAWALHPIARTEPLHNPNDMIVRRRINGITNATFGVPPDIVVYAITSREDCIPYVDRGNPLQKRNPFGRLIC
jgi:hypothetical protein